MVGRNREFMTLAICFSCGATKFGVLSPCGNCKARPTEEDEIAVSMLMTDHHMTVRDLETLSQALMRGEARPVPDEKTMELLRPAVRDAQRMLGILKHD